jgi:hypothetical protein
LGSEYAKCVAGKHPDLVREYVLSEKNSGKRDDRFAKLADWKCLPSNSSREITTLYLSGHGARYVFAEHLLQTEKLPVVDNFGAVAMLVHPEPLKIEDYKASGKLSKQAYAKRVDQSFGEFALSRIGECVVRADTLGSKRLLKTAIGSAEEVAAINTLLPVAGGCIKDGSIKMKPEQVRGTVALNLYRLTVASMQTEKKPDA